MIKEIQYPPFQLELPKYPSKPKWIVPYWHYPMLAYILVFSVLAGFAMLSVKHWDWGIVAASIVALTLCVFSHFWIIVKSPLNYAKRLEYKMVYEKIERQRRKLIERESERLREHSFHLLSIERRTPRRCQIHWLWNGNAQLGLFPIPFVETIADDTEQVHFPEAKFDSRGYPDFGDCAIVNTMRLPKELFV